MDHDIDGIVNSNPLASRPIDERPEIGQLVRGQTIGSQSSIGHFKEFGLNVITPRTLNTHQGIPKAWIIYSTKVVPGLTDKDTYSLIPITINWFSVTSTLSRKNKRLFMTSY